VFKSSRGYASSPCSYPINPATFIKGSDPVIPLLPTRTNGTAAGAESEAARREAVAEKIAIEETWLLVPALVGTAAAYLFTLITQRPKAEPECLTEEKPKRGKPGLIIYSAITIAGISAYIYDILVASDGHLVNVFFPVAGAITLQIAFFAAIYTWLHRLDPGSFSVEVKRSLFEELVVFLYFSITTFATAGGDIAPETATARILVAEQVLFFVYTFTMGMVFFVSP